MRKDGDNFQVGEKRGKNSQGKDPKTFQENSQGKDPRTFEENSQGRKETEYL